MFRKLIMPLKWKRNNSVVLFFVSCLVFLNGSGECQKMKPKAGFSHKSVKRHVSIWTKTTTERVLRSAKPIKKKTVVLGAAQNEWESFQILMRSVNLDTHRGILHHLFKSKEACIRETAVWVIGICNGSMLNPLKPTRTAPLAWLLNMLCRISRGAKNKSE